MTGYSIAVEPGALKALSALSEGIRRRAEQRIGGLARDPRPPGSQALRGNLRGLRKVRIGSYRIAYEVDEEAHRVIVWAVGHRRDFYQALSREFR